MIPAPDVLPLPAPAIIFKILLVFTFLLHVIPMNLVLGGNFIVLLTLIFGRRQAAGKPGGNLARMGRDLSKILPVAVSLAVTFGIAPLLFVQVLYGQAFYSATIIIAWYWYALVLILIAAYYLLHLLREKWDALGGAAPLLSLAVCGVFIFIGYLWTTNITFNMLPGEWAGHYHSHPMATALFTGDAQLLPRFLHFFVGAVAVAGVATAVMGWVLSARDTGYGGYVVRTGSKIFLLATLVQVGVGLWFLLSLPRDVYMLYLGGDPVATGLLVVGAGAGVIALGVFLSAAVSGRGGRVGLGIVFIIVTLSCMLVMRQVLRQAYLESTNLIQVDKFEVSPQWGIIAVFTVALLWGIFAMIKLLVTFVAAAKKHSAETGAAQ